MRNGGALGVGIVMLLATACASKGITLELQGTVLYEKPFVSSISHTVTDGRREGGTVVVDVTIVGDPGLGASFDISPGIATGEPMIESENGRYAGRFAFSPDAMGGPFTIIGRLRHEMAGEVTMRDPDPVVISLIR